MTAKFPSPASGPSLAKSVTLPNRAAFALAALAVLAVCLSAGDVRADTPPSVWDFARDPLSRDRWRLHVRVERLLHAPAADASRAPALRQSEELRLEAARALLEDDDAARSPDVRLRFDLGIVYEQTATLTHGDDLHRRVVDVLAPALDAYPNHPAAVGALDAMAYAYAKLDHPRDELAAWKRYVPRLLDDRARVGPLMNMGEAEMRLGRLDDALVTFNEGLRLCEALPNSAGVNATYALTLWDVAVALDRQGDPAGAVRTAGKAKSWTWSQAVAWGPGQTAQPMTGWDVIRDEREVFFVPDWEREWYLALGNASSARDASDARDATLFWGEAARHWAKYVERAEGAALAAGESGGPPARRWLPVAHARRDHAESARVAAAKRVAKLPVRASSPGRPGTGTDL